MIIERFRKEILIVIIIIAILWDIFWIFIDYEHIQNDVRDEGLLYGWSPYIFDTIVILTAIVVMVWLFLYISRLEDTENALRETKERYQMLVENLYEGVLLEDKNGLITFVNPRLVAILGYPEVELIGKRSNMIFHHEEIPKIEKETAKRPQGISSTYVTALQTKDGRKIRVITSACPLFTNGNLNGILSVITDITDHIQIERELIETKDKYQVLMENLYEGVVTENEERIITFVNPRLIQMVGYTETELIGQPTSLIIPPEEADKVEAETSKRIDGISSTYVSTMLTKDGRRIPVIVGASPLFSITGEYQGVLAVITDITEHIPPSE